MCDFCLKHGANGKWFMNAKNYLRETYDEAGSFEYLEKLWGNMERSVVQKVYGIMNMSWVSKQVNKPIIGSLTKWYADRGFLKDGRYKRLNIPATQGHFGQVVTPEEAKTILLKMAPVVVRAKCPCKYFTRGINENSCLGFTALQEVLPKLPRFIPEHGAEVLDADKSEKFLNEMAVKGRIHTLWCGPVPAIAALCSCDVASCGGLNFRTRFGLKTCWKSHYVAVTNNDNCVQCGKCATRCQFNALSYAENAGPTIKPQLCFGCGACVTSCEQKAIKLVDREQVPQARGLI